MPPYFRFHHCQPDVSRLVHFLFRSVRVFARLSFSLPVIAFIHLLCIRRTLVRRVCIVRGVLVYHAILDIYYRGI